jgi:hypothetical protein
LFFCSTINSNNGYKIGYRNDKIIMIIITKKNGLGDSIPMMDIGSQFNCYCSSGDSYN